MPLATFSKVLLSGSVSGAPILIASSSDPGTTIHVGVAGSNAFDELWLWATNVSTTDQILNVQLGGSGNTNRVVASVTASNIQLILPGTPLNGAVRVSGFCASTSAVNCFGYANRIQ